MEFRIATVTIIGFSSGRTMRKNVWNILQPSILAASSSSVGTLLMKPWNRITDRLEPKPRYMRTSPHRFIMCSVSIRRTSGSITHWNGIKVAAA